MRTGLTKEEFITELSSFIVSKIQDTEKEDDVIFDFDLEAEMHDGRVFKMSLKEQE